MSPPPPKIKLSALLILYCEILHKDLDTLLLPSTANRRDLHPRLPAVD
jgi:hypothetical protein